MAREYESLGPARIAAAPDEECDGKQQVEDAGSGDDVECGEEMLESGKLRMVELSEIRRESAWTARKVFYLIVGGAALFALLIAGNSVLFRQKPVSPAVEHVETSTPAEQQDAATAAPIAPAEQQDAATAAPIAPAEQQDAATPAPSANGELDDGTADDQDLDFWDAYDDYSDKSGWHRVRSGEDTWYTQKNKCYFDNIIHRVNNRIGDPAVCYSACVGVNNRLPQDADGLQCIGWTLIKKPPCGLDGYYDDDCEENTYRGFNVCLLHNDITSSDVTTDKSCEAGKLLNKDLRFQVDQVKAKEHAAKVQEDRKKIDPSRLSPKQKAALEASLKEGISEEETSEYEENEVDVTEEEDATDKEADDTIDGENLAEAEVLAKQAAQATQLENFTETCPARASMMKAAGDGDAKQDSLLHRPMRVFVGCLQASGCTLLSYILSQRKSTVSILDLGVRQRVPGLGEFYELANAAFPVVDTIVLKHAMRGIHSIDPERWIAHIKDVYVPDQSILFVSDPVESFLHLASHIAKDLEWPSDELINDCSNQGFLNSYGLMCGTPEDKLAALEKLYTNRKKHGLTVIRYEEICYHRSALQASLDSLGICISRENLDNPSMSIVNVMQRSFQHFESGFRGRGGVFWGAGALKNTFTDKWGFQMDEPYRYCGSVEKSHLLKKAGVRYNKLSMKDVVELVKRSAPKLYELYYPK